VRKREALLGLLLHSDDDLYGTVDHERDHGDIACDGPHRGGGGASRLVITGMHVHGNTPW